MDRFKKALSMLEHSVQTKLKQHMVGGILMSVSLLFAGLALTVVTLKNNKESEDNENG